MATTKAPTPNVEKETLHAADELIAVTGDKSVQRLWDLGDAVLAASPRLQKPQIEQIRKTAIDKAGHDEFWSSARLGQLGKTAKQWPKAQRVPNVAIDVHREALSKTGSIAEARKVIVQVQKENNGEATTRKVREAMGANGTKAQPVRIDKATAQELWDRIKLQPKNLAKHLRNNLTSQQAFIDEFAQMFADLDAKAKALSSASAPALGDVIFGAEAPSQKVAPQKVKKVRHKGI